MQVQSDTSKKNDFEIWLHHMARGNRRIPDRRAAELLGIARNTVHAYRVGKYPIPDQTRLAMSALVLGVPPWGQWTPTSP